MRMMFRPVIACSTRICLGHIRPLSVDVVSRRLGYAKYGDPAEVVKLEEEILRHDLEPEQVLAKYLVCPVNPADINVL